jgi:hypothetical protein
MSATFPAAAPHMVLSHGAIPAERVPLLICGMFTPSYGAVAERLVRSLQALDLAYTLFEVPTVHNSISLKGSSDPVYTKANFIWHALERSHCPVLYLDVDCVVMRSPELIQRAVDRGHDFAILNWLAQDQNEAYVPIAAGAAAAGMSALPRYYQQSYHVDRATEEQLLCSGAVQLWNRTPASQALLAAWFGTILAQPTVSDDECLDFTFNNPSGSWRSALRHYWLPKSYARYPWWIFDEPVIDHPDIPYQGTERAQLSDPAGRKQYYPERAGPRTSAPFIPRDCVIDTQTGNIFRREAAQLVPTGKRWTQKLWPLTQPLPW